MFLSIWDIEKEEGRWKKAETRYKEKETRNEEIVTRTTFSLLFFLLQSNSRDTKR